MYVWRRIVEKSVHVDTLRPQYTIARQIYLLLRKRPGKIYMGSDYFILCYGGGFGTKTLELIYLDSSAEREGSDTLSVTYPPSRLLCTQIRGRGATMAVPATRCPLNPSLYTGACLPARCTLFSSVDPPLLIDSNVSMPSSGKARHPHPSLFDGSRDRHPVPVPP